MTWLVITDNTEMKEIAERHAKFPGQAVITVRSQGFTEKGTLWSGRFVELRNDKTVDDCVIETP